MLPSSNNNNIYHPTQQQHQQSNSSSSGHINGTSNSHALIPNFQATPPGSVVDPQQHYSLQPSYPTHPIAHPMNHSSYHSIHQTSNGSLSSHHGHHHLQNNPLQPPIPIMNGTQKIPNANNRFVFPNHPPMFSNPLMMNSPQHPYMPPHGSGMPPANPSQSSYSTEVSNSRTLIPPVNNHPTMTAPTVKYNSTIMNNKYSTTISDNSTPIPTNQESYVSSTVPTSALPVWQSLISEMVNPASKKPKNELPLARIKKIMKSDEEVRTKTMISAEAPVLFAKACEMFIIELTLHAWVHTEESKRRTLQRNDIASAIGKTDIFDFLIDIVPRENEKAPNNQSNTHNHTVTTSTGGAMMSVNNKQVEGVSHQMVDSSDPQQNDEEVEDDDEFQIDDVEDNAPSEEYEQPQQDTTPTKNEEVSKLLLPSLDPKSNTSENPLKFTSFVPGIGVMGSQKQHEQTSLVDASELASSEPSQFLDDSQTFLSLDQQ